MMGEETKRYELLSSNSSIVRSLETRRTSRTVTAIARRKVDAVLERGRIAVGLDLEVLVDLNEAVLVDGGSVEVGDEAGVGGSSSGTQDKIGCSTIQDGATRSALNPEGEGREVKEMR
jgi:hypothetical protein